MTSSSTARADSVLITVAPTKANTRRLVDSGVDFIASSGQNGCSGTGRLTSQRAQVQARILLADIVLAGASLSITKLHFQHSRKSAPPGLGQSESNLVLKAISQWHPAAHEQARVSRDRNAIRAGLPNS